MQRIFKAGQLVVIVRGRSIGKMVRIRTFDQSMPDLWFQGDDGYTRALADVRSLTYVA